MASLDGVVPDRRSQALLFGRGSTRIVPSIAREDRQMRRSGPYTSVSNRALRLEGRRLRVIARLAMTTILLAASFLSARSEPNVPLGQIVTPRRSIAETAVCRAYSGNMDFEHGRTCW